MRNTVIIVAAGSGSRMENSIPKQFLELNGLPILMHTIKRFHEYDSTIKIILVLPDSEIETWKNLVRKYSFKMEYQITSGGINRFNSVKNGLKLLTENCIVAIHDGVRPLCTTNLISRCFSEAEKNSNAIPAIRIAETLREIKNGNNSFVDRDNLRIIQTPQCFDSILLKKAYNNAISENFTDDAGVFESAGNKIHLIEGEKNNIKITVKEDLVIASALLKSEE